MKKHITIATLPIVHTPMPLIAPAVLKPICEQAGYNTYTIDLNQEVIHFENNDFIDTNILVRSPINFNNVDKFNDVIADNSLLSNFYHKNKILTEYIDYISAVISYMTNRILSSTPDIVCLSFFSISSCEAGKWLCFNLKRQQPNIKIIIGGNGISAPTQNGIPLCQELLDNNLIDYYIYGDGEESLYQLLIGNTSYNGINSTDWKQPTNLNNIPYANYDDYIFSLYDSLAIGITGSTGCVKKCTFCNVHQHWKKYNNKTAQNIFNEVLHHNKNTNIRLFSFRDNLINGNNRMFKELIRLFAMYNDKNPNNTLHWTSFFIFRPEKLMTEEDWRITSKSAKLLSVGVENFSEPVRNHMKKNMTDITLQYNLNMAKKYNVNIAILLFVGYITDTTETIQQNIQWLYDNTHYINNPISHIHVSNTLSIMPGSKIYDDRDDLGIIIDPINNNFNDWHIKNNTTNTPEQRQIWLSDIYTAIYKSGFTNSIPNLSKK